MNNPINRAESTDVTCKWVLNTDRVWITDCGNEFFIVAKIERFKWCPFCGRKRHVASV